jgi:hypothetical protein
MEKGSDSVGSNNWEKAAPFAWLTYESSLLSYKQVFPGILRMDVVGFVWFKPSRYNLARSQLELRPSKSVIAHRLLSQAAMRASVGKILPESSNYYPLI